MKKLSIFLVVFIPGVVAYSQSVAINTDGSLPHTSAALDVSSTTKGLLLPRMSHTQRAAITSPAIGLMVYQNEGSITPQGFYVYNGSFWRQVLSTDDLAISGGWALYNNNLHTTNSGNIGIGTTTPAYKLQVAGELNTTGNAYFNNNVGVGTTTPAYKLDVSGTIRSSSDCYVGGYLGIGNTSPIYKMVVTDGSVALHNSTDSKYWVMNYSSTGNYFQIHEGGAARFAIANGGNIGIGTTAPAAKLHVNGTATIEGNVNVEAHLTVNNGKGIMRSWNSSQQKYYTREAAFTAILPAFGTSVEGSIGFASAGFTQAPVVLVGDIVSTGGTVGQLWRVQLVVYEVTATSCKVRLINTDDGAVNYDVTWNIVCIGQ